MKSMNLRFWWILLCACVALWGASSVLAGLKRPAPRFDDLTLTITTSPITGAQASVVGVNATVTNNSNHVIFLNQVTVTIWDTDLIAGDGLPFFVNFTGALGVGQSISNKRLFDLDIDGDIPVGTYHGTAAILGGADADADDNQAQQDFVVQVIEKDLAPPNTTITGGPDDGGTACVNTATFIFTGTDDITPTDQLTYQYRVDSGSWQTTFNTQATLSNLTEGVHTFDVAAIDGSGNADPTPASHAFTVLLTPPAISNIQAIPRDVKATVTWATNHSATSQVEYGTTTAYGQASDLNANMTTAHGVILTGLTPKTTYHYRVKSTDGCRDAASPDQMFTTLDFQYSNLSITSLTFTSPVRALDTISVSWQTLNSGPSDATGTWVDSIYLSDTPTLSAGAQLLGKFDRASELPAFNSYDESRQIQMPLKPAGNYYLIVKADADNVIKETSEDDNTLAMPIEFLKVSNLVATPDQIPVTLNPTIAVQGQVQLGNLSGGPLTGIKATIENAQANLSIQVTPPSSVNSLAVQTASYTITASDESILQSTPIIHFTTNEGEDVRVTLNVSVTPRRPQLTASPGVFTGGMTRGKQNTLEVRVTNTGSVVATGLTVSVPNANWLSLSSPATIGNLAPGATTTISLLLTPSPTLALGPYTGNIALNGTNTSLLLPFNIVNTSDAKGDLKVITEDEYTYFAADKPNLAAVAIVIKNAQTGDVVAQGTTDDKGMLELLKLPEGSYNLEATAANHGSAKLSLTILPGQEITLKPFLPRSTVQYRWTVIPVDLIDRTVVILEATFETHVPVPVVTISPGFVDVRDLVFDNNGKAVVNYVITNHGLIDANGLQFSFDDNADYTVTPAIKDLGNLPALTTRVVPVTIQKKGGFGLNKPFDFFDPFLDARGKRRVCGLEGVSACDITGRGTYFYVCGVPIGRDIPLDIRVRECPSAPGISDGADPNLGLGFGGPGGLGFGSDPPFGFGGVGGSGSGSNPPFGFGAISGITPPSLYVSALFCKCLAPILLCIDLSSYFSSIETGIETFIDKESAGYIKAETHLSAMACAGICCDEHNNAGFVFQASTGATLKLTLEKTSFTFSPKKTVHLADVRIGGQDPPTSIDVEVGVDVTAGLQATADNSLSAKYVHGCNENCVSGSAEGSLNADAGIHATGTGSIVVGGKTVGKWTVIAEGFLATGLSYSYSNECGVEDAHACFQGIYAQYALTANLEIFGDKVYSVSVGKPTRHYFVCPAGDCTAEAPEGYVLEGCTQ